MPHTACRADQFTCDNRRCVSQDQRCDRSVDCADGSDEAGCPCIEGEFQCDDRTCISQDAVCNGRSDCSDGSDERDCSRCRRTEFECENGDCVDARYRCNRNSDCADSSDEFNCNCTREEFRCVTNGQCVAKTDVCNQIPDCLDNTDESDCPLVCRDFEFECDGRCVDNRRRCDGRRDCSDARDEEGCPPRCQDFEFECDGTCVDNRRKCDGNRDCRDGRDEEGCPPRCRDFEFECDGTCVNNRERCDGIRDCRDGRDEAGCPLVCQDFEFECDGACLDNRRKCDGNRDCRDGRDEEGCPPQSRCPDTMFQCKTGNCVPMNSSCDGKIDCPDGSDETDCPPLSPCPPTAFQCVTGDCVPLNTSCDGNMDCPDGSDEDGCRPTCGPGEFVCSDGQCAPGYSRCDGQIQCSDSSDERGCPTVVAGIQVSPREMRKRVGTSASFICQVDGLRNPNIRWVRRTGGAMPPQATQSGSRMTIVNLRPEDSGDYRCVVDTPSGVLEADARLSVEYVGPSVVERPDGPCGRGQATCSDGRCIPQDYLCDGEADCDDGSDERECSASLPCEPNEFRCNNGQCAVKIWRCDGDYDCVDGSDEQNCPTLEPGAPCRADEFQCASGNQCVPASYQCDEENDCVDRSDERSCMRPSITTPPAKEIIVEINGTFSIYCEAVGVPTPLIVWRLNWGNIPQGPRVTVTSYQGRGVLTVRNAMIEDAGAYTCEALNNRGSIFAVPDALIIVRRTPGICKEPVFNDNAITPRDCIRCFCFGQTQTCLSSQLQYSQISLGNRVGIVRRDTLEPADDGYIEFIPVSREFKVTDYNTVLRSGSYYWKLPRQFLSKRISSYGGQLSYQVYYEVDSFDIPTDDPDVIITGNGITLYHKSQRTFNPSQPNPVTVNLVESEWNVSPETRLGGPISNYATREQMMIALENVTSLLIRATYDNRQTLIRLGKVLLATAVPQDIGGPRAFAVEDCTCPPGYAGTSCEDCAPGFFRVGGGRFGRQCTACQCNGHSTDCDALTGVCRNCRDNTMGPYCDQCSPGFVGDPSSPEGCQPCPCPLTNPENQFSPTCYRDDVDGDITCDACPRGYEGRRCQECAVGYEGQPTVPFQTCRPTNVQDICDERGSLSRRADPITRSCDCKENTEGRRCDQCKPGTFYLSDNFPKGCISCFCMSVTQTCQSTTFNRAQVRLFSPEGLTLTDKNRQQTIDRGFRVDSSINEISFDNFRRIDPSVTFWSLPSQFLGDKVTAYGGNLRFTIRYVPGADSTPQTDLSSFIPFVEIQGNDVEMIYPLRNDIRPNTEIPIFIPIIESEWYREDGSPLSRSYMLMALADIDYIHIRSTFTRDTDESAISSISLDIAEDRNTGQDRAYAVEECVCPRGYKGLSCEDCAPGYTRTGGGLYLGLCVPCQCNGHSNECDPESGVCRNCRDNTIGDQCERCARGFYGDARRGSRQDCQRCPCPLTESPNQFSPDCILDRDNQVTCTACPPGHTGRRCERCEPGYMGNPMQPGDSCKQMNLTCDCDSRGTLPNTFCDPNTQQCQCKNNVQGLRCSSCRDGYFNLDRDNDEGCMRCFCMDITDRCTSSRYYKSQIVPMLSPDGSHNFRLTDRRAQRSISDGFTMNAERNEITFRNFSGIQRDRESLFFNLPPKFRGDKVSSYGGYIRFGLTFTKDRSSPDGDYSDVDVEIISGGNGRGAKRYYHFVQPSPMADRQSNYEILLTEENFQDQNSPQASGTGSIARAKFMAALADIDAILIRATFHPAMNSVTLSGLSMDIAVPSPTGQGRVPQVESCSCPEGYSGLSCQQCAAGYLRVPDSRTALGRCARCNCNGHASSCDPQTGRCRDCQHNTEGERCERCAIGFYGDATVGTPNDCRVCPCPLDIPSNQFSPSCYLDTDSRPTCDRCQVGYTGRNCERCAPGYVGDPTTPGGRCTRDEGEVPNVIVSPATLNPTVGTSASFQCRPEGRGQFNVVWSRLDGRPLSSRATQGPGPNYVLTINNLEYSDSARYTCSVTNAYGTSRAYVVLAVEAPDRPLRIRIEEPTDLVARPGLTARFICVAVQYSGEGNYELAWSKEGGIIPDKALDQSGVLVIPNLDYSDLGTYTCTGSDPTGLHQAQATITFGDSEPPTVIIEPRYVQVDEGDRAELLCMAQGSPAPTITWTKGSDGPLPSHVYTDETGVLRIDSARVTDQAEYFCRASNSEGTTELRTIIYVSPKAADITVITRRARITATTGSTERLECYVDGGEGNENIVWTRDRAGLPSGSSQSNGVLTLTNIQRDYAGVYYCTVTTTLRGNLGRASVVVTVTGRAAEAPTARVDPERQTVGAGQSAAITCVVTGEPAPVVEWSKVRGELTENHQVQGNVLRIFRATMEDRGMYLCRVGNSAGRAQAAAVLEVERREPPRIEIYPQDAQVMRLGGNAMFQCRVVGGAPTPTVAWTRPGGRPFTSNTEVRQSSGVLVFNGITAEEQGEYVCSATNQMGTVTATVSVRVEGPPSITVTPSKRVVSIVGNRVFMECVATGEPMPTVSWKSGQRRRSDVLPEASDPGPGSAQLLFESVSKSDAGNYICEAINDFGRSTEVVVLEVNDEDSAVLGIRGVAIDGPDRRTLTVGQSVELRCTVKGLTNARISWRRPGGAALPPGHSVSNGVLFIPNIEPEDSGEYICTVTSDPVRPDLPRTENRASVYIIVTVSPRPVIFPSGGLTAVADTSFILNCTVQGPGPYEIEWRKEPGPLSPIARDDNGVLTINRVTLADAGTYICVVTTPSGVIEESTIVRVYSAPTLNIQGPPSGEVSVGQTIDLRCVASGYPTPQIVWDKVEGPLPADHVARGSILRIFNVQPEDSGTYRCTATNPAGRTVQRLEFNFIDRTTPIRRDPPAVVNITVGERVELTCLIESYTGYQDVAVQWRRENGPMPDHVTFSKNYMFMNSPQVEDSGVYTCYAVNQAGTAVSSILLNVNPAGVRRFDPVQQDYATAALGSPAQLRCDVHGSPDSRVRWVKTNGELPDDHSIDAEGGLLIPRVREEDGGRYECQTRGAFGSTTYPVVLVVGALVPYFRQNPTSYMQFRPLNDVYLDLDILMSFKPESTSGLLLYNGQDNKNMGDFVCFGMEDSYPEFRFDNGAGPAIIRGDKRLELNKWHTVKLVRHKLNGTMYVDDDAPYTGRAPGEFQGLDLAQPMYVGNVPDVENIPAGARFSSGYVGGVSEIQIKGVNMNLGSEALDIVGVDQYDVCADSLCQNGGRCRPWNNKYGYVCECPQGFAGERCEVRGERCYLGACGRYGTCFNNPGGIGFSCICPLGLRGKMCEESFRVLDPAFNKTSFISYPTIEDGLLSMNLRMTFKPRSLDDGIVLYNSQMVDGDKDFVAILIKDTYLEFRFSTGHGFAKLQSRQPLLGDEWVTVVAERTGYDGLLIVNNDEPVTERVQPSDVDLFTRASWDRGDHSGGRISGTSLRGVDLHGPLYLGGVNPTAEPVNRNVGTYQGFVGCIGELLIGDKTIDLINSATASFNIQDCGDRSLCERRPCRNGAVCYDISTTEYSCSCAEGFAGRNCETKVTICDTANPCRNGAQCVAMDDGGYKCNCPLNFQGPQCEIQFELHSNLRFMGDGYVEYNRTVFPHRRTMMEESIVLEFSADADQSDGLMFWQGNPSDPLVNDYITLYLEDGFLVYSYELGNGPAVIRSSKKVDDGFVHTVRVTRRGKFGTLQLNDIPKIHGSSAGVLQILNTPGNVFLGGVPDLAAYTGDKFSQNFKGCVLRLELNQAEITVPRQAIGGVNVRTCEDS
ncbi:hypothetical protein RRG08_059069 [Elysia crispata]|uniref:Basement membrane-specific heparan sulfate proteoglycan core protein n=1 Tax=Elysia crispata TaxID=231223 RepID=A0AAE1B853_9GAST|nr:hypothetical protein RRG08_059069 [Elysia crispata]